MRPRPHLAAVLLAAGSACGRVHDLESGEYALTSTPADVLRDDCGLASGGAIAIQTAFESFGDYVRLAYIQHADSTCLPVQLVGYYQFNTQQFYADGTASNPVLPGNAEVCQLNFVSVHLVASSTTSSTFGGVLTINYVAASPVSCNCQLWLSYSAALCVPPACPLPSECPS
ncbi:MAG TPA: hypothetical protein VEJ89_07825 [Myxococcaceae bacterium]|nr:hypothetical protein [Myxococcaceae bacterium]